MAIDWRAFSKAVWQIAYASKKFIIADLQPLSKVILKNIVGSYNARKEQSHHPSR